MQAPKGQDKHGQHRSGTRQTISPCLAQPWAGSMAQPCNSRPSSLSWNSIYRRFPNYRYEKLETLIQTESPGFRQYSFILILTRLDYRRIICKQQRRLRSEVWQQLHFQNLLQNRKTPCAVYRTAESREQKISEFCAKKEKRRCVRLALIYYWLISS